jgi:hypothetical protein
MVRFEIANNAYRFCAVDYIGQLLERRRMSLFIICMM